MRCTSPRTVGFGADGKTIVWSQKQRSKEYATFQLPCSKCLECRLDYARQWAVRCVHEAQMHENNAFITLTYDDKHLGNNRLNYEDFQLFMKKLRHLQNEPIGMFVTGEYGEKSQRKHWHVLTFGYAPRDGLFEFETLRGDKVYSSQTLNETWGKGKCYYGDITFESAGYTARYAAKKITHGPNKKVCEADYHQYQPISKKSSKQAIGKKWLEKNWTDAFNYGQIVLPDNRGTCSIPRYYEKWLKENQPEGWLRYVTQVKQNKITHAQAKSDAEAQAYWQNVWARDQSKPNPLTPGQRRLEILKHKFKMLQDNLKL